MMNEKLPYYLAYPVPAAFEEMRRDRLDYGYMKSMYPDISRRVLPYVEDECDRMEYEGSMMYDEYPDRLQLRMMCRRICEKIKKEEKDLFEGSGEACACAFGGKKGGNTGKILGELIEVMLYQELYRRRCDKRRCHRRIY